MVWGRVNPGFRKSRIYILMYHCKIWRKDPDNDQLNAPNALGQASLAKNSEQQSNELDIVDSQTSPSSDLNLPFPIFTRLQNGEATLSSKAKSSVSKTNKFRKPGKKLKGSLPPSSNNLITSHFKPIARSSDVPIEPEINVLRGVGEEDSVLCILSRSLVTRPPS